MRINRSTILDPPDSSSSAASADAIADCCFLLRPLRGESNKLLDFVFEECNHDAARILGSPRESICGSRLSEHLPAFMEDSMLRQLTNTLSSGAPLFDQIAGEAVQPELGPFRLSVSPAGEKLFMVLRPLAGGDPVEERFRLAARATSDGFWDWRSSDGQAMWWSVGFYNLLGIDSSQPPTWDAFLDRIHPADRKRFENALSQQTAAHSQVSAELRLRAAHNEYRWFRIRAVGRFSEEGELLRIVGAISDIEDLKQAELMLRGMNAQLERRVKERTQALQLSTRLLEEHNDYLKDFAGFASHDLREPLRKIRAYGDLLIDELGDVINEDAQDYLNRMLNAGARMQRLIDDLLIYSRATGREAKMVAIDLNILVAEVLADLEVAISEADASFEIKELPVVLGTPSQFRQLFQNLLANAIKYHAPDAKPLVQVEARKLELCLLANPDSEPHAATFHEICVRDNGIGFPQRFAERIFLPFKRLNNRSAYPGSGIGLALCRRVAERHNGLVYARSAAGEGASIHLLLPAKPDQSSHKKAAEKT